MPTSPLRLTFVCCLFAAASTATLAAVQPASPKISSDAAAAPASSVVPVIIQYQLEPNVIETTLVSAIGVVGSTLHSIHALTATMPASQLNLIAADPNVKYISLDRAVAARQAGTITAPDYTVEPIKAPSVWHQALLAPMSELP